MWNVTRYFKSQISARLISSKTPVRRMPPDPSPSRWFEASPPQPKKIAMLLQHGNDLVSTLSKTSTFSEKSCSLFNTPGFYCNSGLFFCMLTQRCLKVILN